MKRAALALILLLLALATGCRPTDDPPPDPVFTQLGTSFTLAVGQQAVIVGKPLQVTFLSVQRDGRCPRLVTCAEHGPVEILVLTQQAGELQRHEMNPDPTFAQLGRAPTAVIAGPYTITLQAVDPYPQRPEDLESFDNYEATFLVTTP